MTKYWRAILFLGVVGLSLWALFEWRAARVEEIIQKTEPGDVVTVGTDVCKKLRGRGLIARETDCGYRGAARVRIIEPPE